MGRFLFGVNYYTLLFTLLSVTPSVTNFSCIRYSKLCFYMNFSAVPYVSIWLLCEPIWGLFDNAIYCDIYCDTTNRERCRTCMDALDGEKHPLVIKRFSGKHFEGCLAHGINDGALLGSFNLLEHVIGHEVVRTPRYVPGVFVELNGRNLSVLFEEGCGVGNKDCPRFELWYIYHGIKNKIHILQIFCKDMELGAYAKRHYVV